MKKGIPPPKPLKNRIPPPPPVPKLPSMISEEQHQQIPFTIGNQQILNVQVQQPKLQPNQGKIEPIVTGTSKSQVKQPKYDVQISFQKDQMMENQFNMSQQTSIVEEKKLAVEINSLSAMKGIPPPIKSRPGNPQDKKRIGPMKIPPPFIPKKEEQAPQPNIEIKKEKKSIAIDAVKESAQDIQQSIQGVKSPQFLSSRNEGKIQNTVSTPNESIIQVIPQKGIPESEPNLEKNYLQINSQPSPAKTPPPPTFKPGNKKVGPQIKPPIISPMIKQNVINQIQSTQTQENQEKKNLKQKQEKQFNQKAFQVSVQKQSIKKMEKQQKDAIKSNQTPVVKQVSSQSTRQYNELQQKLRRLQELRSKMAQSSEESDFQKENEIQEQEQTEQQIQDKFYQYEKAGNVIFGEEKNTASEQKQFAIGETNYDEMEINEEIQSAQSEVQTENIALQQTPIIEHQDQKKNPVTISFPGEQITTSLPVPAQTVYQSNLSVDQSHRQYLPDELSISPLNSQQSMVKHHPLVPHDSSSNNVYHVDKHRSEANIYKPKLYPENDKKDIINEKLYNGTISQKSDTQLEKLKHHQQNQQHYKIRDPSNQTAFDRESSVGMKENQQPQTNLKTQKLIKKSTESNIEELLRQFRTKKSQYLQNVENLKLKQTKFEETEEKYRQRISQLIGQVNHKNLLLLKYTTGLTDITLQNDNQITQTEQL